MKIGKKVAIGISLLCAVLFLCGMVGYTGAVKIINDLDFITTKGRDTSDGVMEAHIGIERQMLAMNTFMHADQMSPDELRRAGNEDKEGGKVTDEALARVKNADIIDQTNLSEIDRLLAEFRKNRMELLNDFSQTSLHIKYRSSANALMDYLAEMENISESKIAEITNSAYQTEKTVKASIIAAMAVGIILSIVVYLLSVRLILRPLQRATAQMQDIAQGEGDLTVALEAKGHDEIAELGRAFNTFVDKIRLVVSKVSDSTTNIATAAEEMSRITDETNAEISRQLQETDHVAAAVTEMTQAAQDVARNAASAASAATSAEQQTVTGSEVVSATMNSINNLSERVTEAAKVIQQLHQESDTIGKVLDVIRGIADQTNLLALNAAIEAARAGEQGRGFAVVADEVRTLAQRTQSSTLEIQGMIERLQSGARKTVEVMEQSRAQAAASVEQVATADKAFHDIADAIKTTTEMATQIATAAEEQTAVTEEISHNVVNIRDISDQSANRAENLASAGAELAHLASQLQEMVRQFKT